MISFGSSDLKGHIEQTPPLPDSIRSALILASDPSVTLESLQANLQDTPDLQAQVQQVLAEGFPNHKGRTLSMTEAPEADDAATISQIIAALAVRPLFKTNESGLIDGDHLWGHSVACGLWSRILIQELDVKDAECLFVSGLLHDIGMVSMHRFASSSYEEVLSELKAERSDICDVEVSRLGYAHDQASALLCEHWNLAAEVIDLVRSHHTPSVSACPKGRLMVTADQLTSNTAMVELRWKSPAHLDEVLLAAQGLSIDQVVAMIEKHADTIYQQIYAITQFKIPA